MTKTAGYIVQSSGEPCRLSKELNVLWLCGFAAPATLFPTLKAARVAINATCEYGSKFGYIGEHWKAKNLRVRRVVSQ